MVQYSHIFVYLHYNTWYVNKVRELLIAEYHHGHLQNNFGTGFVEWPSELPLYYS